MPRSEAGRRPAYKVMALSVGSQRLHWNGHPSSVQAGLAFWDTVTGETECHHLALTTQTASDGGPTWTVSQPTKG